MRPLWEMPGRWGARQVLVNTGLFVPRLAGLLRPYSFLSLCVIGSQTCSSSEPPRNLLKYLFFQVPSKSW